MRISSSLAQLSIQKAMGQTQKDTERALKQLATGSRFAASGVDAAGHAISENMRSQIKASKAARNNAENAASFVQVAEGALNEQNNILIRLRELAIQSASDTYSDTEREFIGYEYTQLTEEFDRLAKTTRFGSQPLLDGTTRDYEFQVGINPGQENVVKFSNDTDTTADNLGVAGLSVGDKDDARDSLESIDEALNKINQARAKLGAVQNRMDSVVNNLDENITNLSEAHGKQSDTDVAEAISTIRRGQVLAEYQASVLAMSNQQTMSLLKLVA
jgi:flagellin